MLVAISIQRIDPAREDVYLASVDDQERVVAESPDFVRRTVLRSQAESGLFWVLDEWREEAAMHLALAMARTIATPAALIEEPRELAADGEEVARGLGAAGDGGFTLVGEGWIKQACLGEYERAVRVQADRIREEPGFLRRLLLVDRRDPLHRWVVDDWSSERAAYDSFQASRISEGEALAFLALFAERGTPLFATTIRGMKEISR